MHLTEAVVKVIRSSVTCVSLIRCFIFFFLACGGPGGSLTWASRTRILFPSA